MVFSGFDAQVSLLTSNSVDGKSGTVTTFLYRNVSSRWRLGGNVFYLLHRYKLLKQRFIPDGAIGVDSDKGRHDSARGFPLICHCRQSG